ncbi:LysR family transcriptional regulator [Kitasatospora sp. NPDC058965]|uniref:LysR family transcriptional regulator n=1 Tax=Kitasatospora sp. NPDC058965 TaxID=3346682 RepID=UPI0036B6B14A
MDLELHHLRTLCAIADAGSVSRAAATLGYSQPAISRQLRRVEEHFGGPLFQRSSAGVEPTAYGCEVLAQARDVLARADAMARRPAASGPGTRPPLRLAATNTPVLPGMVTRLRAGRPPLDLRLSSVYSSAQIVELLEQGELEAGIAADYPGRELRHSGRVAVRAIVTEPTFVALSARHRLRHRAEIDLADLAGEAWFLTPDDGAGWPGVFHAACREAGFRAAPVHEFLGEAQHVLAMIADGLGVAAVQGSRRPVPGVVIKPLAGTPLSCRYVLAWRRDSVAEDVAQALFDAASAAYEELTARAPQPRAGVAGG